MSNEEYCEIMDNSNFMSDFTFDTGKISISNIYDNTERPKTEMKIGSITIYNTKFFNKFQKKMLKWCFGFDEINDIE